MENTPCETRRMFGRRIIKTDVTEITTENLSDVLMKAASVHAVNSSEIEYLWRYYKGDQPILHRQKDKRPEICNKIVENRANEIVSFKVGYLCGEPIQYVGRTDDTTEQITRLNEMMFSEDKASQDQEIVEWQMICGTAYRLVLPDPNGEEDDAPFELYTLDPRETFIVYSDEIGNKPLMAVKCSRDDNEIMRYSVYTKDTCYTVKDSQIVKSEPHNLGMIPIFEYPANNARLGAFEIVLPLLDELNNIASNRMDGLEQFIQSFWKFVGCRIDEKTFKEFLEKGAIMVPPNDGGGNIDVDLITRELNQQQTQTFKEDCYNAVLTICGMPNRNGGSSTSDTGAAVLLRDGWSLAEARAKDSKHMFKRAEKRMLKLVLRICKELTDLTLTLKDIDLQFTRRNYDNIQSKSQVLVSMLNQPKIHPLLAFQHSGLFVDPESAYAVSKKYYDEQMAKWEPIEVDENDENVSADGQVSKEPEAGDKTRV